MFYKRWGGALNIKWIISGLFQLASLAQILPLTLAEGVFTAPIKKTVRQQFVSSGPLVAFWLCWLQL